MTMRSTQIDDALDSLLERQAQEEASVKAPEDLLVDHGEPGTGVPDPGVTNPVVEAPNVTSVVLTGIVQRFPDPGGGEEVVVLDGIDLELQGNQINMLLGPSGCGKSTLMNLMGGMRPYNVKSPSSGTVLIDGKPCTSQHDDVVTVFQRYTSFPHLTVFENVMYSFGLKLWKRRFPDKKENEARVRELLNTVGLLDKADHYPDQLSGGQQQRVALARALAVEPRILLMDEPLGALDAQTRQEMQDLLCKLHNRFHTLIVFVTHDIDEALRLGDRIIVLSSRPATVAADIRIYEQRPRPASFIASDRAVMVRKQILSILEENG